MGDRLHTAWTFLTTTTLGQGVLLVTLIVGLCSIFKDVWKIAVGVYQYLRSLLHWYRDRQVLRFIKATHPHKYYEVSEIATALRKKRRKISQSLQRLLARKKVRRFEVNEHSYGIWLLDESDD
jgi:hypothetical protein